MSIYPSACARSFELRASSSGSNLSKCTAKCNGGRHGGVSASAAAATRRVAGRATGSRLLSLEVPLEAELGVEPGAAERVAPVLVGRLERVGAAASRPDDAELIRSTIAIAVPKLEVARAHDGARVGLAASATRATGYAEFLLVSLAP